GRRRGCNGIRNGNGVSLTPNEILLHTAVVAADAGVAEQDQLVVDLEARDRLLLPSAGIDRADIQIRSVEDRTTLGSLSFLKNFSVELLHEQHGGAPSEDVIISG